MPAFAHFAAPSRLLLGAALCLCAHATFAEPDAPGWNALTPTRSAEGDSNQRIEANALHLSATADPVVMTINGVPVSAREYRLVMQRHTAAIYGQFARAKKFDDHAGYWSRETGPEGPLAKLRELVATELTKIKVRQILGRDYGFVSDISFDAFLKQRDAENTRRATAVQTGQVIYGPQHYRLSAYYYLQLRDLEFRLKQRMSREFSGKITDTEIERTYAENEATLGKKPLAEVRLGIIGLLSTRKAAEQLDRLCAEAKVTTDTAQLAQITPRSDPPAAIAEPAAASAP